ncbi:hypothetical protein [Coralliovum pocilloporae]|uniref:hypothetical protein n=1 Tax=Coralliovum pocilloporae TaxID=3066369 RepID=UPI003307060A
MISELRDCIHAAKDLLKTSSFDFYITQFEIVDITEFATTKYAVQIVKSTLSRDDFRVENSRRNLESEIHFVCENLLTYTVDDACFMQSEFHWYYCIGGDFIYKESELGVVETPNGEETTGRRRVAKISDLPKSFHINLM